MEISIPISNVVASAIVIACGISYILWRIGQFRNEWYGGTLKDIDISSKRSENNTTMSNLTPQTTETTNRDFKIFIAICLLVIAFSIWGLSKLLEQNNPVTTETVLYISLIISMDFFIIVILIFITIFRAFSRFVTEEMAQKTSINHWLEQLKQVTRQSKE